MVENAIISSANKSIASHYKDGNVTAIIEELGKTCQRQEALFQLLVDSSSGSCERAPNLLFLMQYSSIAVWKSDLSKSGHMTGVKHNSVYARFHSRKFESLISPPVLIKRSGSLRSDGSFPSPSRSDRINFLSSNCTDAFLILAESFASREDRAGLTRSLK